MPDYSVLIVCAWMLPLLFQVAFPLFLLVIWLAGLGIKAAAWQTVTVVNWIITTERRTFPRITPHFSEAIIAENGGKSMGKVENISTSGICITGDPDRLHTLSGEVTLRAGESIDFKLLIQPRWEKTRQSDKVFGALILNKPVGWSDFSNHLW